MSDSSSERLLAVVDALDALAREQTPIEAAESLDPAVLQASGGSGLTPACGPATSGAP